MNKKSNVCIVLGVVFLTISCVLFLWNRYEDYKANLLTNNIVMHIIDNVDKPRSDNGDADGVPDPYDLKMTEKEIDGIKYVGYLYIPSLNLDLPVISQWSYAGLKMSPCRYYGSSKSDDLVIAAHNYKSHFGKISSLKSGDEVVLSDMDGVITHYEVVATDILGPFAIEDMTSGDYALTLFTCTYGGKSRVTVRCDRKR